MVAKRSNPQMCCLLDVNILVALCLRDHVHHTLVNDWWARVPSRAWASCAITELGFIRVVMNAKVNPEPLNLPSALETLTKIKSVGQHRFWPSLVAPDSLAVFQDASDAIGFRQTTDLYLLATAMVNNGQLATLDRGVLNMAGNESKKWCEWID